MTLPREPGLAKALLLGAAAAWYLHIYADQFDLARDEFDQNFAATVNFVREMLTIYESVLQNR